MARSYDIFLSHSGAQKEFVEQLFTELRQTYGQHSVFFDKDSIRHGEQISSIILEYAKTCKLAVAVLSEEYFTRSKSPMMELAASYTASKNENGVPCLLPVFLKLKPEHAKDFKKQEEWFRKWTVWELNEIMSEREVMTSSGVLPKVWMKALRKLLDTRGPVYKPHENQKNPEIFLKEVARIIAEKLDELSKTIMVPDKVGEKVQQYKESNRSDYVGMEHMSEDLIRMEVSANTSHFEEMEKGIEFSTKVDRTCHDPMERKENVAERERNVTTREINVTKREINVAERERNVTVREKNVTERENFFL